MKDPVLLSENKALDRLRLPGHCLALMHDPKSPDGHTWFVIPGGRIRKDTAATIIKRPDVKPSEDGLFPGCSQTYKLNPA